MSDNCEFDIEIDKKNASIYVTVKLWSSLQPHIKTVKNLHAKKE